MFKVGDVVQLKSGGPPVTVLNVSHDDILTFLWFASDGEIRTSSCGSEVFNAYKMPPLMQVTTRDDGSVDISIVPEGN